MRTASRIICPFLILSMMLGFAVSASAKSLQHQLSQESALEQVLKRGILRIGFSTFVPWAMKDKTGKFVGFEIDVATRLAKDMGVKPEFVPTKWSGIIPALLTGKFDIIIGGMGIRPERNLKVNFSIPYEFSGMSLVANKNTASGKTSLEAFNSPNVTISARIGTTAASAAKTHLPKATLRLFDDEAQALQEVLNKRADAMVSSEPFPAFQSIKHPKKLYLPLAGETFTQEPIGFAIRKGDVDFLNFLNNWILVTDAEGWLKNRHAFWFKTMDWESDLK
ncbi:MAG TPA: transporter substrate-binding domain-containing protein [Desulfomicrobiaceae bacterium]|nr:transporter substrate-binding domain-containing protein [Desulfomicrobiaceae bacterium]